MPQLWKSGKPAAAASTSSNQQQGSAMSPPAKGFFICPPKLVLGEGGGDTPSSASSSNGFFSFPSSPPSSPTSPTHHQHPPKYDQLLNELRRAQERRGRLQNDAPMGVSSQPLEPAAATAATASTVLLKNAPLETMLLRRTIRSPEPPSGTYVNHFNSSGAAGFAQRLDPVGSKSPRMTNKAAPKKVRFLEDGTGNLHTSVFGGSAESIGSLLDSHSQELNQSGGTDDIDSLISSLISYSDATDHRLADEKTQAKTANGTAKHHNNGTDGLDFKELRTSAQEEDARQNLNESTTSSSGDDGHQQQQAEKATLHQTRTGVLDNFLDIFRCGNAEVVDQRQTVVHLEPDDPNSVDSGSVLSELDFEETSSTITDIDSNKTFSLHSPDNSVSDHRIDDWSQVSDLLERSLQEIRQMEEDTNKSHPVDSKSSEKSKREPLYELIGWKRNPPLVQLDLRGSKPFPLPSTPSAPAPPQDSSPPRSPSPLPLPPPTPPPVETDVWIPRQDWVPPAAPTPAPMVKQADKVWIRRPTLSVATHSHNSNNKESAPVRKNPATEEANSIYGRLWETSSSPNNSSRSSSCSAEAEEKPTSSTEAELTAIRSMARKARLEHWRLTGMSSSSPVEEGTTQLNNSNPSIVIEPSSSSPSPAYLSSLPLFNHRAIKTGIQLTWPPPPLPQSPSSSATATPVTPTLPPLPATSSDGCQHLHAPHGPSHNGHSPKCFGHQRIFQWPIPALKLANKRPKQAAQPQQENATHPSAGMEQKKETGKPSWRPAKPANLEEAQDWYWTEEFPLAAGLEPGTGNMSAWFHAAISRWEAERRLTNQPAGAFLARLTERLWGYAISVRNPSGNVSHFLIDAGEKRCHKKYTLLGSTDPPHKSLRELIQYYGKHALTPDGSEKLLFPCPQESSVAFPGPASPNINGSSPSRLIKST
ncbi:uncharacterized protein LOC130704094 [Daphnia carinata]|uniref:uncharacterized protein LOC130704094 n=1 Tax=Daphnia carinata TaxID=120202 RepID=UPI00258050D2|nr:uncharacterized protein LOC130704094 [Daphnia carinata]